MTLRRQLATYQQKYGPLEDELVNTSNGYHSSPIVSNSTYLKQDDGVASSARAAEGPYEGPIHGTVVDVMDDEIDIANFRCLDMEDPTPSDKPIFNSSGSSFVRTVCGMQRPNKPVLPNKDDALKTIDQYLSTVNTYVPLLHGPTISQLARTYFEDPAFQPTPAEDAIIILILANMNVQVAVRNPAVAKAKMKDAHHLFHYGLSRLSELWIDGSLESMQAMALLLLQTRIMPKPGNSWRFSHLILGRAIELNYHRSPSTKPVPNMSSPLLLEMRKRVFWQILGINVATAAKLGRPMPLRLEDIDVELPLALEDSEISHDGVAPNRSGRCTFWAGLYFFKLQPLLMRQYNDLISVRRPSGEYLNILNDLDEAIMAYRRQWSIDISVEPARGGTMVVATHHVDSWAAEFQMVSHHPKLCTTTDPIVAKKNLDVSYEAAQKLLSNAMALTGMFRGMDITWHSMVGYTLGLGVTLQVHSKRKDSITRDSFEQIKQELAEWLKISTMGDKVLGTGGLYYGTFKPLIERVLGESSQVLLAHSALQNGSKQESGSPVGGFKAPTSYKLPPPGPYQQSANYNTTPYANTTNNAQPHPNNSTSQGHPTSAPPLSHPPLYPEPYHHSQTGQSSSDANTYSSIANQTPTQPSQEYAVPIQQYANPVQQQAPPQILSPPASEYIEYQQGQDQSAYALLALQNQGWDDASTQAMWPDVIYAMQQLPQNPNQQLQRPRGL